MREADDIECVFESMGARGSIYISNYSAARNVALLKSKGIKAILSVARSGQLTHSKEDVPHYLYIPMEDHQDYEISKYFGQTYDFIEQGRRETNVLIHCMVGVSRSVTIAIAYLLRKYKYTLAQVIALIQRKRKKINPNPGFLEQLQKYSESIGIKCDFHDKKVPAIRDTSASRQVKAYSLRKDRTPLKIAEPLTPIPYVSKQRQKEKSLFLPLKANDDMIKPNSINFTDELAKVKPWHERPKKEEPQHNQRVQQQKIEFKKSISIDEGKGRRRSSIEQKISKIREKILKTQHQPDSRFTQGNPKAREHGFSSKRIDLSDKNQRIGGPLHPHHPNVTKSQPVNHVHNYFHEQNNKELFSTQLKIESKAFYSHGCRQNPRFSRAREEIAQ